MALLALLPVTPLVHIIDPVAGKTGFRRILVTVIDMTAIATNTVMGTGQPEVGLVMIEADIGP